MSTLTLSVKRRGRPRNLRHNIKIMDKLYDLVNPKTGESVIVHPPKSMLPGLNMDGKNAKDPEGRWVRVFRIEDSNGVKVFKHKRSVVLNHLPGDVAGFTDASGTRWNIRAIEGVHAEKARGKARQTHKVNTRVKQVRLLQKTSPATT
jgi:hypothetical protein